MLVLSLLFENTIIQKKWNGNSAESISNFLFIFKEIVVRKGDIEPWEKEANSSLLLWNQVEFREKHRNSEDKLQVMLVSGLVSGTLSFRLSRVR